MTKYLIFLGLMFFSLCLYCQTENWEVYGGVNHSNVRNIYLGQQITRNHTLNAPRWAYGYQLGVNKVLWRNKNSSKKLGLGIRYQLKGDKLSFHEIFPRDTVYGIRFQYLMLPLNFEIKLLKSRQVFFKQYLSPGYLFHKQKIDDNGGVLFPWEDTFSEKIELSYGLGFDFEIANNFFLEIIYSEGLTNITKERLLPFPDEFTKYRNQSFELSVKWQL